MTKDKQNHWNAITLLMETIAAELHNRGFIEPIAEASITDSSRGYITIRYKNSKIGEQHTQYFFGNDLESILNNCWDYIYKLKTPLEMEQDSFRQDLATLIEKANRLDFPTDKILNALQATMKELSENIITHQKD